MPYVNIKITLEGMTIAHMAQRVRTATERRKAGK
jgi:hypothetical protein